MASEHASVVWFDPTDSADADARAAELCSGLDLAEGMLLRVAYFDAGVKPGRLLLVVHRLAIDAASWPILLQDLLLIYGQLQQGRSPLLPPKTTSVRAWAERLAALDGDAAFWQQQLAAARLPRDHSTGANTAASAQEVTMTLPAEASRQLLEVAPAAHRAETNELLLTALAQAVSDWSGEDGVGIMLDAADRRALAEHASQGVDERMDVSRTVGWLAPSFPLWLNLRGRAQPGECLAAVKEQMRAVPHAGLSFDPTQFIASSLPEVHFEYSDLTATIPAEAAFAPPQPQSHMPPHTLRTHVFNVKCGWAEGCLQVTWQYSAHLHERATVAALADAFVAALTALIIDAPALATADFSDFGWGQDDIGDIMAQLGA